MTVPEQSRAPRYVLVSRSGIDTLHRDPGEQCNLDDTEADQEIDRATAAAVLARGQAELCRHCVPLGVDDGDG